MKGLGYKGWHKWTVNSNNSASCYWKKKVSSYDPNNNNNNNNMIWVWFTANSTGRLHIIRVDQSAADLIECRYTASGNSFRLLKMFVLY